MATRTIDGLEDGRQWCIVFEGNSSAMRAACAAMLLRTCDVKDFMLHEWKPPADEPKRRIVGKKGNGK